MERFSGDALVNAASLVANGASLFDQPEPCIPVNTNIYIFVCLFICLFNHLLIQSQCRGALALLQPPWDIGQVVGNIKKIKRR